jgi:hypothetical protein
LVFGQSGFTGNSCNQDDAAPTASTLCNPEGVVVDADGNLYVADALNNRVLTYLNPLTADRTADLVLGQDGSFTAGRCNQGLTPTARTLCVPSGVALDGSGNLYVPDQVNERVLVYEGSLTEDDDAQVWQCFGVSNGDDPRESMTLSTEFGEDDVTVRRAVRFCEVAATDGGGPLETQASYLCYTLTGGLDPNADITVNTEDFGQDDLTLRSSTMMCESAEQDSIEGT